MDFPKPVPLRSPRESLGVYILLPRLINEAPRSLLRGILQNSPKPLPPFP